MQPSEMNRGIGQQSLNASTSSSELVGSGAGNKTTEVESNPYPDSNHAVDPFVITRRGERGTSTGIVTGTGASTSGWSTRASTVDPGRIGSKLEAGSEADVGVTSGTSTSTGDISGKEQEQGQEQGQEQEQGRLAVTDAGGERSAQLNRGGVGRTSGGGVYTRAEPSSADRGVAIAAPVRQKREAGASVPAIEAASGYEQMEAVEDEDPARSPGVSR